MENVEKIAEYHADIWFYHDEAKFDKLENSARLLFSNLGFKNSKKAAKFVRNAYFYYDMALENPKTKQKLFEKVRKNHKLALDALNEKNSAYISRLHTFWWKIFSKNKKSKLILPLIYFQNLLMIKNPIKSFNCSKQLVLAGLKGHNKRDKKTTIKYLKNYWKYCSNQKIVMY